MVKWKFCRRRMCMVPETAAAEADGAQEGGPAAGQDGHRASAAAADADIALCPSYVGG